MTSAPQKAFPLFGRHQFEGADHRRVRGVRSRQRILHRPEGNGHQVCEILLGKPHVAKALRPIIHGWNIEAFSKKYNPLHFYGCNKKYNTLYF